VGILCNDNLTLRTSQDHGDHVVITHSKAGNGGGLFMLGRSDGVLSVLSVTRGCPYSKRLLGTLEEYVSDHRKFTM